MRQLQQLISAHFKEFFREPGVLFWTIAFPILMAWGLGIAFTQKGDQVSHIAMIKGSEQNATVEGFLDRAKVEDSTFIVKLGNEKLGYTNYHLHPVDMDRAIQMIKRGEASMIIDGSGDKMAYRFDPQNSEAQLAYLQVAADMEGKDISGHSETIEPLKETGTRYVDFLVPGLLAMGIMMSAMWGISYNLIDKRNKKLLRRMVATPMHKSNFLMSHLISRVLLSVFESLLLLAFTWMYFRIQIQGSLLAFVLIFLAGNMAFVGLAIFASSRTSNTQVGNGLINLVVMPMMVLSGIFFSYHNFPEWFIPIIKVLPLTMLADGIRGIFIEGAGVQQVLIPTLILGGMGVVFFSAGMKMYKWY